MSIYDKYNLKRVINSSGKMTALGVSKYNDKAIEAQSIAGKNFFEMDKLYVNVGKYVADLVGSEDAQIVSSASAGLVQSVCGIIGQGSKYHLYNPYTSRISKREIIVPKGQNVDFGAPIQTMVEVGGGKVIEAGYANKCTPELLETQINENTAAILFVKSHHAVQKSMLSIEESLEVAKRNNIPLIMDAAAELDLKKYIALGVDIVIYSGAKALEGTSSGVVFGKKRYIEWIRMQSKGLGRSMKIGKENILGLAAAIEDYLSVGPETGDSMKQRLKPFVEKFNKIPNVNSKIVQDAAGRDIFRAQVTFDKDSGISAAKVRDKLKEGNPAIYIREHQINNGILEFDIRSVNEDEMSQIITRMKEIVLEQ